MLALADNLHTIDGEPDMKGIEQQGTYHRGIDDARNVASIIKEILG